VSSESEPPGGRVRRQPAGSKDHPPLAKPQGRPAAASRRSQPPAEPDPADTRRYAAELRAMLRQRDPAAYRAFLVRWRDLHERGAAQRLAQLDDAALRQRIERMIIDLPALADLHPSARAYLDSHGEPHGDVRGEAHDEREPA
jgi:hypothetical protein